MAPNNKKIFSPEDFDKETSENKSWWKHNWKKAVPIGILCTFVIVGIVVSKSDKSEQTTEVEGDVSEEVVVAIPEDTIANGQASSKDVTLTDEALAEHASNEAVPANPVQPQSTAKEVATTVTTANVSNDIEAEAMKVIRGDYGIGQERKDRLGDKYQPIQNRVNELKREGVF